MSTRRHSYGVHTQTSTLYFYDANSHLIGLAAQIGIQGVSTVKGAYLYSGYNHLLFLTLPVLRYSFVRAHIRHSSDPSKIKAAQLQPRV